MGVARHKRKRKGSIIMCARDINGSMRVCGNATQRCEFDRSVIFLSRFLSLRLLRGLLIAASHPHLLPQHLKSHQHQILLIFHLQSLNLEYKLWPNNLTGKLTRDCFGLNCCVLRGDFNMVKLKSFWVHVGFY